MTKVFKSLTLMMVIIAICLTSSVTFASGAPPPAVDITIIKSNIFQAPGDYSFQYIPNDVANRPSAIAFASGAPPPAVDITIIKHNIFQTTSNYGLRYIPLGAASGLNTG